MLKELGLQLGTHLSKRVFAKLQKHALEQLSEKVACRLLGECGEKAVSCLAEAAPLFGACIGGFLEGRSTRAVGRAARDMFLPIDEAEAA